MDSWDVYVPGGKEHPFLWKHRSQEESEQTGLAQFPQCRTIRSTSYANHTSPPPSPSSSHLQMKLSKFASFSLGLFPYEGSGVTLNLHWINLNAFIFLSYFFGKGLTYEPSDGPGKKSFLLLQYLLQDHT